MYLADYHTHSRISPDAGKSMAEMAEAAIAAKTVYVWTEARFLTVAVCLLWLIFGYTEDVSRFNYGLVHGSKSKIGNLIVGWNEAAETIVVVPTVPDLSGCGDPTYYRRSEIHKAYRNKYPTDAFIIYPDRKGYIGINAYDWLEDESLYIYVSQGEALAAFTDFFLNHFAKK